MGRIFYVTNRNPDSATAPTSYGIDFNGAAPGRLTCGIADVTVPAGNTPDGRPMEASTPAAIRLSDPSDGDFSATAKQAITAGPPHLVISVHGFQYLFWESVTRAEYLSRWFAQGAYGNENTVIAFGWPSAGDLAQYERDYGIAGTSGQALAQLLMTLRPLIAAFRQNHGAAARVTLLAHSMGNHVVDAAFAAVPSGSDLSYDRILLVAADESRGELAPTGKLALGLTIADRVYVYYNNQDFPLAISASVYHPFVIRLGMDGPPNKDDFKGRNISFINASAVNYGDLQNPKDSERHQYYRMIPEVRDDIGAVMRKISDDQIPNRIYRDDPHYGWENYWRINGVTAPSMV